MLVRIAEVVLAVCLVLVSPLVLGQLAEADDNDCPPGYHFFGYGCVEDDPTGDENDDDDGRLTGCTQQDPFVDPAPCEKDGFTFVVDSDSYVKPLEADQNELYRPPNGALSHLGYWEGDPDEGWMYEWRKLAGWGGGIHWGAYGLMWLADGPDEQPVVDPEALARAILDRMEFEPVEIGLAPKPLEQNPDSIGVVGAPVWMWVTNAGPTTWGPLEESTTVGGIAVTVTAEVQDVVWDMGDGSTKTCTTTGKEYREAYGVRNSPSCGYQYERTSRNQPDTAYSVSATTTWTAEWTASTDASGSLEVEPLTSTVHARIGERQVIEVG